MRVKSRVWYGFLFVLLWASVTYFLFLYRPIGSKSEKPAREAKVEEHLKRLEGSLKEQFHANADLLVQLRQIIRIQSSLPGVVNDNVQEEVNEETDNKEDTAESNKSVHEKIPAEELERFQKLAKHEVPNGGPVIAVIVFACNRVTVHKCLAQLIKYRPSKEQFPIIVSQDCDHKPTADVIAKFGDQVNLIKQPDQGEIAVPPKEKKFKGYFKIARHYGWALNHTFFTFNFDNVIIVEDDLDVSPDIFEYFLGTYPILKRDPTLWCVSAWNDNGKTGLVDENAPELLYRTDFFPGLGWLLTKDIWTELSLKWPASYWDDWVRQPEQRKNRACIRPELSRTRTFGKVGVSNGFFFEKHLKFIKLNEKSVPFTKLNLTYLLKDNYDVQWVKQVYETPIVSYQELKMGTVVHEGPVRIPYHTKDVFKKTAKMLGLMDEFRSGVPRTGYRGVVSFMYRGRRVYLAPSANWKGYDPSWS